MYIHTYSKAIQVHGKGELIVSSFVVEPTVYLFPPGSKAGGAECCLPDEQRVCKLLSLCSLTLNFDLFQHLVM